MAKKSIWNISSGNIHVLIILYNGFTPFFLCILFLRWWFFFFTKHKLIHLILLIMHNFMWEGFEFLFYFRCCLLFISILINLYFCGVLMSNSNSFVFVISCHTVFVFWLCVFTNNMVIEELNGAQHMCNVFKGCFYTLPTSYGIVFELNLIIILRFCIW